MLNLQIQFNFGYNAESKKIPTMEVKGLPADLMLAPGDSLLLQMDKRGNLEVVMNGGVVANLQHPYNIEGVNHAG